jgi:hypothetical protein
MKPLSFFLGPVSLRTDYTCRGLVKGGLYHFSAEKGGYRFRCSQQGYGPLFAIGACLHPMAAFALWRFYGKRT